MSTALQENNKYCKETIELKKKIEFAFLEMGERLAEIREHQMYAPSYDSFPEFLDEMQMSEATASRLIGIYMTFVVDMKLPKEKLLALGGWSDLGSILPMVKSKAHALNLIETMAPMRRADRRAFLTSQKTGIAFHECRHPKDQRYTIEMCRACKQRIN